MSKFLMNNLNYILGGSSLFMGMLGAWFIGSYGHLFGMVDTPKKRSSHRHATPKGGGIGILISFVIVCLVVDIPFTFWFPVTILSLFNLYGDRVNISPIVRLPLHLIAAFIVFWLFIAPDFDLFTKFLILFPVIIFVVGTANFYNFMDGINGIAGITGIVGFGLLIFFGYTAKIQPSYIVLLACISLACAGFLPFNIPKAKVFMGDVGSILLGFVFGVMVVKFSRGFLDFILLSSFLFPFYADELTTMAVRLKKRENLLDAHRSHLYQIMSNEMNIAHWKVSVIYGLIQLFVGISVLLLRYCQVHGVLIITILVIYFFIFSLITYYTRKNISQDIP